MGSFKKIKKGSSGRPHKELRFYQIEVSMTVEDFEDFVRTWGQDVHTTGQPFYIVVSGYDDDPRELRDIPEVQPLCQRVIDSGLLGLLGDNAALGLTSTNPLVDMHMCFLIAKGGIVKSPTGVGGVAFLTEDMAREFLQVLEVANEKVDRLIAEKGAGDA